ncbi:hypothetical protein HN011_003313, partial [Eciton burchellii]
YLDRITKTVPIPKEGLLDFGLPKWKTMSLERKIPMIPAPKDAYNLTRCKVGKKLWTIDGPKLDFDLSDPYHYETQFSYEALHDRHLLGFFTRPINMRYLLKAGLITEDMSVKCSLYEYNVYRQYLRKIHGNRVGKELRKRDCLSAERRILRHAEEQARQQVDRLKRRERLATAKRGIGQQRALEKELRDRERKRKAYKVAYRFKLSKLVEREGRRLINAKRKERAELIRQKCHAASEIARLKRIEFYLNWKKKEKAQKRTKDKWLRNIARCKQNLIEERWKKKIHVQERDMTMEKSLLQRMNTERQKRINDYKDRMNREIARMQRLLDNAKLFTACYLKRHVPRGRTRICCKRYYKFNTNRETKPKEVENNLQNLTRPPPKRTRRRKRMRNARRKDKSMPKDRCTATTSYDNLEKKRVDIDRGDFIEKTN